MKLKTLVMKKISALSLVLIFFISFAGYSQDCKTQEQYFFVPSDSMWVAGPPTLPPGPEFFLLEGDIKKKGPIIIRLKLPSGYVIPPHFHPGAERSTVLSGKYNMGIGETVDKTNTTEMPGGSIAIIPAGGIPHFGWASEETIIQVQMEGPLKITYSKPEDDPRIK